MTLPHNYDLLCYKFYANLFFQTLECSSIPKIHLDSHTLSRIPTSWPWSPDTQRPPFSLPTSFQALPIPTDRTLFYLHRQSKINHVEEKLEPRKKCLLALLYLHLNPDFGHSCIHIFIHSFKYLNDFSVPLSTLIQRHIHYETSRNCSSVIKFGKKEFIPSAESHFSNDGCRETDINESLLHARHCTGHFTCHRESLLWSMGNALGCCLIASGLHVHKSPSTTHTSRIPNCCEALT